MPIAVAGLWHLGSVTAACLAAADYDVFGYDPDTKVITELKNGKAPVFEPGLNLLIDQSINSGKIHFYNDRDQLIHAEILWVTFDTPVDEHDIANVESVTNEIKALVPYLQNKALVIISSQLPVGSTRKLSNYCKKNWPNKGIRFAVIPENLRLGKAIDVFTQPDRIIVGLESDADKSQIQSLLQPFSGNIIWMTIESAEMTKHALNAFLATSVVFINELSILCERVGANAREVERGLKSEERIGSKAYLRPGNAIAGGTLARDVNYLIQMGQDQTLPTPLFSALLQSNDIHKQWSHRRLLEILKNLDNKKITLLGLAYKVGTDTLRRSAAIETCEWLNQQGAKVSAYDPAISTLSSDLIDMIELNSSLDDALLNADAVIITTEYPQFMTLTADQLLASVKTPHIFDASGFLMSNLAHDKRISYYSVGI